MKRLSRAVERQKSQARIAAGIWSAVALVSLAAATMTALSDRGLERIAGLIGPASPGFAERIAARVDGTDLSSLSAEFARLRSEVRLLALENEAIATKLARIETDGATPLATASLPDPGARQPATEPRQVYPPIPFTGRTMAIDVAGSGPQAELEALVGADARAAETVTVATRFALELGSGGDVEELDALWQALVARHEALLGGLEPKFGVLSGDNGERRLLLRAGPIVNAADAIAACTAMRLRGTACSPVSDAGERLVIR